MADSDGTISLAWDDKMALLNHFKGNGTHENGAIFDATTDYHEEITVETSPDATPEQIPIEMPRGTRRPRHIWGLPGYLTNTAEARHQGIVGYDPIAVCFVILVTGEEREYIWRSAQITICRRRDEH